MTIDYELLLQGNLERANAAEEEFSPGRLSNTEFVDGVGLQEGYQSSVFRTFTPLVVPAAEPLPEGALVPAVATDAAAAATPAVATANTSGQPAAADPARAATSDPAAAAPGAAPTATKTVADLGALANHARGRSVVTEAQQIAGAMGGWAAADRVSVYRELLRLRASSQLFQVALARAMDGASWQAITADPQGVNTSSIQESIPQITEGEAAGGAYVESWWERHLLWAEVYVAAYIAQHGAADLASKLSNNMADAARPGRVIGRAQRDGLITAADVTALTSDRAVGDASAYHLAAPAADLRQRFDEAQAALRALDQQLLVHLHEVGPALYDPAETDPAKIREAQTRVYAYMAEFRGSEQYQTAKREAMEAAQALGVELQVVGDDMLVPRPGAAEGESNEARSTVIGNYEALARSADGAFEAVRWAESHRSDSTFSAEEQARIAQVSQIGQETDAQSKVQSLQTIFQNAAAAASPDERKSLWGQAMSFVKDNVATPYNQINTIVGASRLLTVVDEINRNVMIDAALTAGDTARAIQIAHEYLAAVPPNAAPVIRRVWSNLGVLIRTLRGTDSLFGATDPVAAVNTAKKLYDNLHKLRTLMETGQRTVDTEREALRLVESVRYNFNDFNKLGWGALDVAATLMTLQGTMDRAAAYPDNVALQINMICEFVGLFGSVLTVIGGPLAPIGAAISTIASVIGLVASVFIGDPEGDQRRGEEAAILATPAVLGDEELAAVFTTPESSANMHAAQAGGVTRDQLLELGHSRPWLFEERELVANIDTIRTWLGRHPELGRYTSPPTLYQLISTIDQRTLQDLAFFGGLYGFMMRADQEFPQSEHLYVASQAAMLLDCYQYAPN